MSSLTIDMCQGGCAGLWFDRTEVRSVDEPTAKAGETLVALAGKPQVTVDATKRRRYPRCPDSVLMRHFYSAKRAVTVNECPTCAGMWLDGGELEQIRAEFESGGARQQAVQVLAEELLVTDRMALMRAQLGEELPYETSRSRIVSSLRPCRPWWSRSAWADGAALRVLFWSLESRLPDREPMRHENARATSLDGNSRAGWRAPSLVPRGLGPRALHA